MHSCVYVCVCLNSALQRCPPPKLTNHLPYLIHWCVYVYAAALWQSLNLDREVAVVLPHKLEEQVLGEGEGPMVGRHVCPAGRRWLQCGQDWAAVDGGQRNLQKCYQGQ